MNCPICDRDMTQKESSVTHASGKNYDWKKFNCSYCDTWIESWEPQKDEE